MNRACFSIGKAYLRPEDHLPFLQAADKNAFIKLATEQINHSAQQSYRSPEFIHTGEMGGNDMVFVYRKASET